MGEEKRLPHMHEKKETPEAIIITKSRDYLLGYIDCTIQWKNNLNIGRLEFHGSELDFQEQNEVLGPVYLDISCTCGNYRAFKTADDIPHESLLCDLCQKIYLIYYTE